MPMMMVKAVSDAAQGGMVLVSEATYRLLPMEKVWQTTTVMHCGEHVVDAELPPVPMYQVLLHPCCPAALPCSNALPVPARLLQLCCASVRAALLLCRAPMLCPCLPG
jgi:hypothetical protein